MRAKHLFIKSFLVPAVFLGILSLTGCVTFYNAATGRREALLIDTPSEVSLGRDMDKEIHKKMAIVRDAAMQARLDRIGQRVANYSDRQDLNYYFQLVQDKELNAFAVPGGYIYINTGLFNTASDNELAGVLAHEIGHIAARHSVKQIQAQMGYQLLMNLVLGIYSKDSMGQAMNTVFNLANLGYSRADESLADKLAVKYTRRAGFDPYGIVSFFNKLEDEQKRKGSSRPIPFLSSHPLTSERIAHVKQEIINNP